MQRITNAGSRSRSELLKEIKISMLNDFFDKEPLIIPLAEVMQLTQQPELKKTTESIRSLRAIQNDECMPAHVRSKAKAEADKQKQKTPVIFTSTLLEHGKKRKNIKQYLELMGVDVDHKSKERVMELMRILRGNPHVVFAQPSSSGEGIHAVLLTDAADFLNEHWDGSHTDAYNFVWEKMREFAEELLGEKIDEGCKNPEHSFALCYDELTFMNLEAEPLHIDTSDYTPRGSKKKGKKTNALPSCCSLQDVLPSIEKELDKQNCHPEEGQRNMYVYRFAAISNTFGVDAEEVEQHCIELLQSEDFTAEEIVQTIRSAYSDKDKHGTKKEKNKMAYITPEELENEINQYGQWRLNEVSKKYEVMPEGETQWRPCKDEDVNEIYRQAMKHQMLTSPRQIETFIHSRQTAHFNPIEDYRDSLPTCTLLPDGRCLIEGRDEPRDYIGEVADRLHTTSPQEDVRMYFKKWIVETIKGWMGKNDKNELVFGLLGEQGKYKTTFFRYLLPESLRQEYFDVKETNGQFDKDEMIKMSSTLIYLQEEFDEMSAKELNQFKAIVSLPCVNVRRPYAHNSQSERRLCSFCFTGNSHQILTDSTGNRRFLPFWVESIDCPQDNPIDYEAFYAQAFALARPESGFVSYIPSSELDALNEHNKEFCIPVIEHELVDHFLSKPQGLEKGSLETVGIITAKLQNYANRQLLDKRKIGAYLRQKGFQFKRTSKANGNLTYYVRYMTCEEIQMRSNMESPLPDDVA